MPKFEKDLISEDVQSELLEEISLSHELYAESYPSLVLSIGDDNFAIKINYNDSKVIKEQIENKL